MQNKPLEPIEPIEPMHVRVNDDGTYAIVNAENDVWMDDLTKTAVWNWLSRRGTPDSADKTIKNLKQKAAVFKNTKATVAGPPLCDEPASEPPIDEVE